MKNKFISATLSTFLLTTASTFGALTVTTPIGGIPQYDGSGSGSFTVELTQAEVGQQFQDPNRVVIMTVSYIVPTAVFSTPGSINLSASGTTVTFDSTVNIPTGTNLQFTFSYDTPLWSRGADGTTVNGVTPPDFIGLSLESQTATLGTSIRSGGFRGLYDGTITEVIDANQGTFATESDIFDNFRFLGRPVNRPANGTSTFLSTQSGNAGIRGTLDSNDNQISSTRWSLTAVTDVAAGETPLTFTTDGALEAVPEPSSMLLGALGILALLRRRRA